MDTSFSRASNVGPRRRVKTRSGTGVAREAELLDPVPSDPTLSSDEGASPSTGERRFFARIIPLLMRPPGHGRCLSAAIILILAGLIGWLYVATDGVVSLQVFYLVPVILAVSWLGLAWGVAIAVLSACLRFIGDMANAGSDFDFFASSHLLRMLSNRVSSLLVYLVVVVVIHELLRLSRQLEERVQARTTALRQAVAARERLQASLFEAGLRERKAIGRDLHDGLGQHLAATAMAASVVAGRLEAQGDPLVADAREVERLVKSAIDQTRQTARGLLLETVRPDELVAELEELAAFATHEHRTPCVFTAEGAPERLDLNVASHLFYIAREALRNALRHGGATRIAIHFCVGRALVALIVTDNGRGLSPGEEEEGGVGLRIMSQRAELIGGKLSVGAGPGGGTRVDCRVPLPVPS